jgi:hypothetical protein
MRALLGLALLMVAASLALYVGVAQPRSSTAATLEARIERMTAEQAGLRERIDRHASTAEQARDLLRRSSTETTSLATIRRRVLAALSDNRIEDVRLDVAEARPPGAANVKVEATGGFLNLVALSTRLSGPEVGVVLTRVTLERARQAPEAGGGTEMTVEGIVLGRVR